MTTGRQQPAGLTYTGSHEIIPPSEEQIQGILNAIDGHEIERQLVELAGIGGAPIEPTDEQPVRFAANRPALSENDQTAREELIRPLMEGAGMAVLPHPLADIGVFAGRNPDLRPLVLASHTDTIPKADMVDGVYGVFSAIAVIKAMKEAGFVPDRDIIVASYTGEESYRFGSACFGSKAILQGLGDDDMSMRETLDDGSEGQSLEEILGEEDAAVAREPLFGEGKRFKTPHAVIELHVEQDIKLEKSGHDIGVVERIAAPERFKVKIGGDEPLAPEPPKHPHLQYLRIHTAGQSNHSGATDMGTHSRADGLVWTSHLLEDIFKGRRGSDNIAMGQIQIDEPSMNKIPGITEVDLRMSADTPEEMEELIEEINQRVGNKNQQLMSESPLIDEEPISISVAEPEDETDFFDPQKLLPRQKTALMLIKAVEEICSLYSASGVVGTVGTYSMDKTGVIGLSLDVRGMEKASRDMASEQIRRTFESYFQVFSDVDFGERLVGSRDPVKLNGFLVRSMLNLIDQYEIGSAVAMESKAMHDVANAADTGIASALLFVPSRGGIAHDPEAFTAPEHLEKGARALGIGAVKLSQFINDPVPKC
jgi:acetylornithine deacetylase/succinyl-diaminopimelate desuccinylase-like protein